MLLGSSALGSTALGSTVVSDFVLVASDSAVATESAQVSASILATDSASATDETTPTATQLAIESATGSEAVTTLAVTITAEQASASDVPSIVASMSTSDAAAGDDTPSLTVVVTVSESAHGQEGGEQITLLAFENAVALDPAYAARRLFSSLDMQIVMAPRLSASLVGSEVSAYLLQRNPSATIVMRAVVKGGLSFGL